MLFVQCVLTTWTDTYIWTNVFETNDLIGLCDLLLLIYAVTEEIAFVMREIDRDLLMQLMSTVADLQLEVIYVLR